jgi:dTDP-4-amino-4,6-dideoxygalactose transaminase
MASIKQKYIDNLVQEDKNLKEYKDLAFSSGIPAFEDKLHVGRPNIGNRDRLLERINDILDNRWLSNNGPYVQEFERNIAQFVGAKHCIATCNATVALEIAIRAAELKGEVIIPSFTFIATAHALQWQEITPVFCDIDSLTHSIDPAQIESMITPRTTGIIGVHLWGKPCNIEALTNIAYKHNLKLIFDAAHAFGCSYKGQMIGNFGELEVFSFHATKFINSFEGGAIVTNNDELAAKIRLMENFGFAGMDNVIYVGTNGKMSEVSAAMGLTSLESIDDFIQVNYDNYKTYAEEVFDIPGVHFFTYDSKEKCTYQYIVLEVDEEIAGITRDKLVDILHLNNIIARKYFYPGCHRMEPYKSYFPHAKLLLPETEKLSSRILVLPTGTAINKTQIKSIMKVIRDVISETAINKEVEFKNSHLN